MTTIFLFIFGLLIGSFLNVLSFRYFGDNNIFLGATGRSHCPHCKTKLRWYELIPVVSFCIQKAHCRSCGQKISWQYPVVELLSGLILLIPLYVYNPLMPFMYFIAYSAIWIIFFLLCVLIWTIDMRLFMIPDELNLVIGFLGILLTGLKFYYHQFGMFEGSLLGGPAALFGFRDMVWVNAGIAALFGFLFFGTIIAVTRGRGMGLGDLKLVVGLGLLFGWPDILIVVALSFIVGSVWSLFLLAIHRKKRHDSIPFGPFLVIGAALVFLYGEQLLNFYFQLVHFV